MKRSAPVQPARITVFAGHYGSGKTTLAVGYALWLKRRHPRVALCDLDIVNPYFRTRDAAGTLEAAGVELISSRYAGSNVDVPAMPADTQRVFDDRGIMAVMDLGGDDRGALALGRYAGQITAGPHEMLLVANRYRPLTRDVAALAEIRAEIEAACRVPFTGLVNNSNLGAETTAADVLDTLDFAEEAGRALGLPVKLTAVDRRVLEGPGGEALRARVKTGGLFTADIIKKNIWI
jgi:hypothetical protein